MINDEKFVKISLSVALIGVIMIYFSAAFAGSQVSSIKDIRESDAGKQVRINGTIFSISENKGNLFIGLQDGTGNMTVVMFERTARDQKSVYALKEGDKIIVNGQVNVYKNELEIISNSISKV